MAVQASALHLMGRVWICTCGTVRLWVDRSFTIRGAGTVVTGTLGHGALAAVALGAPAAHAEGPLAGPPPTASIINYGKMETKSGGSLFLVSEKIENHGTLMAPDGTLVSVVTVLW